jgi:hypothetical protein
MNSSAFFAIHPVNTPVIAVPFRVKTVADGHASSETTLRYPQAVDARKELRLQSG